MAKLVVEVLDASNLMPKDGHGSASPFVEVEFEEQRHRTSTKHKDLNPYWDEKLVFNIKNPKVLPNKAIDVLVYNDCKQGHKNFLGKVRISGMFVPPSEQESIGQRYPLEKRGPFSHVRGYIALKIYTAHGGGDRFEVVEEVLKNLNHDEGNVEEHYGHHHHHPKHKESAPPPLKKINTDEFFYKESHDKSKKKNKDKEAHTFYSIPEGGGEGPRPRRLRGRRSSRNGEISPRPGELRLPP